MEIPELLTELKNLNLLLRYKLLRTIHTFFGFYIGKLANFAISENSFFLPSFHFLSQRPHFWLRLGQKVTKMFGAILACETGVFKGAFKG